MSDKENGSAAGVSGNAHLALLALAKWCEEDRGSMSHLPILGGLRDANSRRDQKGDS